MGRLEDVLSPEIFVFGKPQIPSSPSVCDVTEIETTFGSGGWGRNSVSESMWPVRAGNFVCPFWRKVKVGLGKGLSIRLPFFHRPPPLPVKISIVGRVEMECREFASPPRPLHPYASSNCPNGGWDDRSRDVRCRAHRQQWRYWCLSDFCTVACILGPAKLQMLAQQYLTILVGRYLY